MSNGRVDLPGDPVNESGLGRAPIPQIIPTADAPPYQEVRAPGVNGLGALGSMADDLFAFLETKIMGVPLWFVGAGVVAYLLYMQKKKAPKYARNPKHEENDDDYDDNEEEYDN